ncbi:hypothetical protein OESDEN_17302 [Oesophagostomum dentatum]|uniref:Uncharacterized protein n=1 Tax=Oesophagostomum dentatum TaxID=61180 RepID=A0A0B1SCG9_OESDE|nr:hypothetical protein OESDEN_17302 [Oesophagostomum dentatum]
MPCVRPERNFGSDPPCIFIQVQKDRMHVFPAWKNMCTDEARSIWIHRWR